MLLLNTGGTFSKRYNPISGTLEVPNNSTTPLTIIEHWLYKDDIEYSTIVMKDSLEIDDNDREEIAQKIITSPQKKILLIHGTDTIDKTASYLANLKLDKTIVLTGAMVPFEINPIEATANLSSAICYTKLQSCYGVYLCINGVWGEHKSIQKNRIEGRFVSI